MMVSVNSSQFGSGKLTLVDDPTKHVYVGDVPAGNNVWIGDWPPQRPWDITPVVPNVPWNPPIDAQPYPLGGVTITTSGYLSVSPWRVDTSVVDRITLALDVPGVKVQDLKVEIDDGWVRVSAVRFDTKATNNQTYYVGPAFDPTTCEATLEAGVLTLIVMKFVDRLPRKVNVKVK